MSSTPTSEPQTYWHPVVDRDPPSWASEWGEDEWGAFATALVGTVEQRMRWIPAGTFWMGSPESEAGRGDDEVRHLVTLRNGFWLADTPCSQELWVEIMGENPSRYLSEKRPVDSVSWHDCQEFLRRLGDRFPDFSPRLPTEAEWEHACRAGHETATWAGDLEILGHNNAPILDEISWYGGNSGVDFDLEEGFDSKGRPEKQFPREKAGTRIVGLKAPNPWGLYDMLGNVYEWCADWIGDYPIEHVENPVGPEEGSSRVYRGGSWFSHARNVRSAARYWLVPGVRDVNLGFRLARGPVRGAPER